MNTPLARALRRALPCVLAAIALLGCGKKDDPVAQAVRQDVAAGVPAPGIAETQAIAEEASSMACRW